MPPSAPLALGVTMRPVRRGGRGTAGGSGTAGGEECTDEDAEDRSHAHPSYRFAHNV